MKEKELSELTDEELLEEFKRMKSSSMFQAFFIGFMIAVVIYSIIKNTWGLLTLIPLFFIYRLSRNSNRYKKLKEEVKERNLD